jgi:energy-coupling factor transporter ATP-binding protein EcfA2
LNKLLRKHKDVEKKHFKLWFSSSAVLTEILNNAIKGRSRSYLQQIRNKIPLYVLTESFDKANVVLEKQKLLVITGMPGIGKTTLANVLLLEKARLNYKVYIINSIRDAEDVISNSPDEKQIFYFDDFLGDVYYQMISGSQRESEINQFINRIVTEPNKYLILSTRTVILEQAKNLSEKIKRSLDNVTKHEIELSQYSKYDKAKILYNHMYFGELESDYIDEIITDKFYYKIINHKNYTPRLVEFITEEMKLREINIINFREYIIFNLDNPEEVWRSSFETQIKYLDKCFLYTLFTFGKTVAYISDIMISFESRLNFEKVANNQQIKTNQFNDSIKNLLNGFIYKEMSNLSIRFEIIRFINPSISDFLLMDLKTNESEKTAIINSATFIEQLLVFDDTKTGIKLSKEHQMILLNKFKSKLLESLNPFNFSLDLIYLEAIVKY